MRVPPFCPRRSCRQHWIDTTPPTRWWSRAGHYRCAREGRVQRFVCRECGHRFSESSFSIDYFAKRRISYHRLLGHLTSSASIRATARLLHTSPGAVTCRITRLARQALAVHAALSRSLVPGESLVADGFESFSVSQYCPNNFNLLVGSRSQYVYALTVARLRRSGRMTDTQRRRREALERVDRADSGELPRRFAELLETATGLWRSMHPLDRVLLTDRHPVYRRAVAQIPLGALTHHRISSRLPRTTGNRLFSVNYIDREIRKDLAEHRRETVCFARNTALSLQRMWIYLVHHNSCKPYRISPRRRFTHAEQAGVSHRLLARTLRYWLTRRVFLSRTVLSRPMLRAWMAMEHTPFSADRVNRRLTPAFSYA